MGVTDLYALRFNGSIFRATTFFFRAGFFLAVFTDRAAAFGLEFTRADFLFAFVFFFDAFAMSNVSFWRDAALNLAHRRVLCIHILSRKVVCVKRTFIWAAILLVSAACSRLPTLTPNILTQAEQKWIAHKPVAYRLVIEMSGDRVETGRFQVEVRGDQVVSLRRNG